MPEARTDVPYQGVLGVTRIVIGLVEVVLGALLLENRNEEPDLFVAGGALFVAWGAYLLISSAVARGVELAQRR